jgi:uncharacterized protein
MIPFEATGGRALRMAALCHDIGHLPFSHAAEAELLPNGWDHEKLTRELILSEEMQTIWSSITPPLRAFDVVKLAVGQKKANDLEFTDWQAILSEIVVGDAFGVDRRITCFGIRITLASHMESSITID